jgi:hypothetical protein
MLQEIEADIGVAEEEGEEQFYANPLAPSIVAGTKAWHSAAVVTSILQK